MAAPVLFLLAQLRSRWRGWLGLALLVGTIGFTRRQVRAAVAWQAATLTVVALAIGIPAGIIGGRFAWLAFARQIGVLPVLHVQPLVFPAFVVAMLILALVVSALPGESAARTRAAGILRGE